VKTVRWRCLTWNGTVYPWEIHRPVRQWPMRSGLCSDPRYRPDKLRAQTSNILLKGANLLRIDRYIYIYIRGETAPSGPGPRYRGFTITLRHTTLGKILDEWSARRRPLPDNTRHSQQTSTLPSGFKRANPASERPQTHTLVRAATGIGSWFIWTNIMEN
jgi:hypothetical protein